MLHLTLRHITFIVSFMKTVKDKHCSFRCLSPERQKTNNNKKIIISSIIFTSNFQKLTGN